MRSALLATALAACMPFGCDARQDPKLCVCETEACATELETDFAELDCDSAPARETNAPLFVLHRLPPNVELDEKVSLRLSTPCTTRSFELEQTGGASVLSTLAPPGTSCSLEIAADIANSSLRHQTHGAGAERCEVLHLAAECPSDDGSAGAPSAPSD
jgi:hypothetical protein